jgi:23S rRNA pseudouridine1911/1915/1917 synthase
VIPGTLAAERLDRALAVLLPDLSRSRLKALIEAGTVRLEAGATIGEPSRKVKTGEAYTVSLPPAAPAIPEAQAIPLVVLFEDDDLIVVDKPAGLVVHPAPGNPDRTLVNALLAHCGASLSGIGGVRRPGIVHRLDKDTSGVMVVAKNDAAHRGLAAQFAVHSIERTYLAATYGAPMPRQGLIEGNIGRHSRDRKRMTVVVRGGKPAATRYRVLETFGPAVQPIAALVECRLLTGRTHQVRVHLTSRGNPLLGDPVYSRARLSGDRRSLAPLARALNRQALHAVRLGFEHPSTGEKLSFEGEIPSDLKELIAELRAIGSGSNT